MIGQLSLFEMDEIQQDIQQEETRIGKYQKVTGAVIPHIMRPGYIGKEILVDKSTKNNELYMCGVLEDYIYTKDKVWRCIVYTGKRQRDLIDMVPGVEIYETKPLNRMEMARQNLMRRLWG